MSEIKRKSGKYPFRPTEKEMHIVDTFNNVEILKSYLKVEIGRIQGLIDREYFYVKDITEDTDYPHYEQGKMDAFKYVLSRLEESNKEEVK